MQSYLALLGLVIPFAFPIHQIATKTIKDGNKFVKVAIVPCVCCYLFGWFSVYNIVIKLTK